MRRLDGLLERRLTVLQAPGGFGKTTVLADIARDAKERGLVVGWISLDEDDTPNVFGSYLADAFEQAGLNLSLLSTQDTWTSSPAVQQMGMLARAVELHEAPCLLVLDEVDRLPRRTLQLIDLLLKRAPRNLHVAMAFRADPELDLALPILDEGAVVVGAEDLRFSQGDIGRYLQGDLSSRELAAVEERTAGWPVALRVYRNTRADAADENDPDAANLTERCVCRRVLRDLSSEERACLLDRRCGRRARCAAVVGDSAVWMSDYAKCALPLDRPNASTTLNGASETTENKRERPVGIATEIEAERQHARSQGGYNANHGRAVACNPDGGGVRRGLDRARVRCGRGASGQPPAGAGGGRDGRAGRGAGPHTRHDPGRD